MKNGLKEINFKIVSITIILTLLIYILLNLTYENRSYAYDLYHREEYNASAIEKYPGYKELIENMKKAHPNWKFTILYTGLDWNQVIKNETTAYHGRNLVAASRPSSWKCSICNNKSYDTGWNCASEAAVSYFMDSRNWINDSYIFQFENLSYNGNIQTVEGVQKIIADVGYMQGSTITYTKTDGTTGTINKSYAQVIMDAAYEAKISPYHLASRIRQEQGAGSKPGSTATGTYNGYVGYYNFLNIGASGNGTAEVIANGLKNAKNKNWTDPEISIREGAKVIAKNYINAKQDTLYLQKFDVDGTDGTLYYFQYMQNVEAARNESTKVRDAYEKLGFLDSSIEFIIPVYENMPETVCGEPVQAGIVTQNVKINGTNVHIRSGASTSTSVIATLNTGDVLIKIEEASSKNEGYYWDKVVLPDGRQGYVARSFIVNIPDITSCNETVITNTSVNLRNGPGTTGTTVITTLIKGQVLTRIEKGKYNLDGYVWDKVKLADGRQGYMVQRYIDLSNSNESTGEIIKVICQSGLKVRTQPGTDKAVATYLSKGETLTRTQANVSSANGYTWDKVVTLNGVEGYIARGNSTETYIEVVSSPNNNIEKPDNAEKNNNFKLENEYLVCEPSTTIEDIKEKYSDTTITVKNASGAAVTTGNVGTSYTITIGDKTYTIVKLGDANGDGKITPADSTVILRAYVGLNTLNENAKLAANVNSDQKITPADSTVILRAYVGLESIKIKSNEEN